MNRDLVRLARDLPEGPGVYIWKDAEGQILYVGKAKSLRRRVSSYLRTQGLDRKTRELMERAQDLETIVTSTEREALILEASLIRQHQPRFNIALKDDRRHAWISVDCSVSIPSFVVTRETDRQGALYFGPYGSIRRLQRLIDTLRRYIPVATCRDPSSQRRVCIDYHIGRCSGPCQDKISRDDYQRLVEQMTLSLIHI